MQPQCPPITDELVAYLDEVFPDTAVAPQMPDAAIHYGAVAVVRHLKMVKGEQEQTPHVSP